MTRDLFLPLSMTLPRDLEPGLFGMIRWPPLHRLGIKMPNAPKR
jgi:hypothetical protein